MSPYLKTWLRWLGAFGVDPVKTTIAFRNVGSVFDEYRKFRNQNRSVGSGWPLSFASPNFHDRLESSGIASGHYFHQDLLVARKIFENNPERHVDVGSRVDGFVAHVAVFRQIEVIDLRPQTANVRNIVFHSKDILDPDFSMDDYCDSLSCLHALEHFGLGRYGDPIAADGYEVGFRALVRMLEPNGVMYLSFPIGRERVEFNGERVFSLQKAFQLFSKDLTLQSFSYIDDGGNLHPDIDLSATQIDDSLGLEYGCGIFELRKISHDRIS